MLLLIFVTLIFFLSLLRRYDEFIVFLYPFIRFLPYASSHLETISTFKYNTVWINFLIIKIWNAQSWNLFAQVEICLLLKYQAVFTISCLYLQIFTCHSLPDSTYRL